jgi:hypothetical protein
MATRRKKVKDHPRGYYSAYIVRGKDPVIDQLRGMAEGYCGHSLNGKAIGQISKDGGPSAACMRAWFFGDTRRPQNTTIEAAGRAMGFERVWRKARRNQPEE